MSGTTVRPDRASASSNRVSLSRSEHLRFRGKRGSSRWAAVVAVSLVLLLLAEGAQDVTAQNRAGPSAAPAVAASPPQVTPASTAPVPTRAVSPVPSPSSPGYASLCLLGVISQCALRASGGAAAPTPMNGDPPSSWKNITPLSGQPNPVGRFLPSMAFDPATDSVLMFGGYGELGTGPWVFFQDTWSFSNGAWTEVVDNTSCTPTTCPSARAGAMLAYDAAENGMILFGGYTYTPEISVITFSDTWLFSNGVWQNLSGSAGTPPSPRFASSMVWDSYDNYVLLFGGELSPIVSASDTWTFDGTWTNITTTAHGPPAPRDGAAIANSPSGYIMLFGGEDGGVLYSDNPPQCSDSTVAWWFYGGQWVEMPLSPTCVNGPRQAPESGLAPASSVTGGIPPCGRVNAALGWSPANNRFVLFGGEGYPDQSTSSCSGFVYSFLNDTWTYQNPPGNGFYWQNATDPGFVGDPPARAEMGYAADFADNYFAIFGGYGGQGGRNDTWRFNEIVHAQLTGPSTIDTNSSHLSFNVPFTVTGYGGSGFLDYKFAIVGSKTGNTLQDASGSTGCANLTNPSGTYVLPYDGVANTYCSPTPQSYNVYRLTVTVFDTEQSGPGTSATANWTFTVLPPETAIIYSQFKGYFYTGLDFTNNFSAYLKVAGAGPTSVSATLGGLPLEFTPRSTGSPWWDSTSVDMANLVPGAKLTLTATFSDWTLNATYSVRMINTPAWLITLVELPGTTSTVKAHGSGPYNKTWSLTDVYNWNIAQAFGFDLPIPLIGGSYSLIPGLTISTGITSSGNVSLTGSFQFNTSKISIGPASIKITATISLTGTFALVTEGQDVAGINWVNAVAKITVTGDFTASVPIYGFNILGVQIGFTLNIELKPSVALSLILVPTTDVPLEIIPGLQVTLSKLLGSFTLPLSVSVSFGIGIASVAIGGTLSIALTFNLFPSLGIAGGWVNGSLFVSASALFWSDQWTILGPAVIYSWTDPPPSLPTTDVTGASPVPGYDNGTSSTWKLDSRYYSTSGYDQNVWNASSSGGAAVSDIYPFTSVTAAPGYDGSYLYYTDDNVQVPVDQGLGVSGLHLNSSTNSLSSLPSPSDPNFLESGPQATTLSDGSQFVAWAALPAAEESAASPLDLTQLDLHGARYSPANGSWGPTRSFTDWGIVESYQVDAGGTGGLLLALISPTFLVGDSTPERLVAFDLATGAEVSNVSVTGMSSITSARGGLGDAVLRSASGNYSVVAYATGSAVPVTTGSLPTNTSLISESFVSGSDSALLLLYREPTASDIVLYDLGTQAVIASWLGDQSRATAEALFGDGTYYVFAGSTHDLVGWAVTGGSAHNLTQFSVPNLAGFGVVQVGSSLLLYALSTNGNVTAPLVTLVLEEVGAALPEVPGRPTHAAPPSPPATNSASPNSTLYLEYLAIAAAAMGVLLAVIAVVSRRRPKSPGPSTGGPTVPPPDPPEGPA
ncbi:MAG TPA: hypothetical protein VMH38_04205 [Thermoplasmata archaeon]|nr:hypothetical protein [Thermoplasmata archaeon]